MFIFSFFFFSEYPHRQSQTTFNFLKNIILNVEQWIFLFTETISLGKHETSHSWFRGDQNCSVTQVCRCSHQIKMQKLQSTRYISYLFIYLFFIVTFTLHLNAKNLQLQGNLNWYITWENKKLIKNLI